MAAEAGRDASVKSRGMALIDPEIGLELLGRLMKSDAAQVAVMDAQWGDLLRLLGSRRPALLAEIAAEVQESSGETVGSRVDHAFRQRLLDADEATRTSLVQDYIRQELARIMGIEPCRFGNGSTAEHVRPRFVIGVGIEKQSRGPARFHVADGQADGRSQHRVAGGGDSPIVDGRIASDERGGQRRGPTLCRRLVAVVGVAQAAAGRRSCCCLHWVATCAATPRWCSN